MNTDLKVIYRFGVLFEGWECDSKAWVVEDKKGKRWIETTNHGSKCIATKEFLEDQIEFYQSAIDQTKHALALVAENEK